MGVHSVGSPLLGIILGFMFAKKMNSRKWCFLSFHKGIIGNLNMYLSSWFLCCSILLHVALVARYPRPDNESDENCGWEGLKQPASPQQLCDNMQSANFVYVGSPSIGDWTNGAIAKCNNFCHICPASIFNLKGPDVPLPPPFTIPSLPAIIGYDSSFLSHPQPWFLECHPPVGGRYEERPWQRVARKLRLSIHNSVAQRNMRTLEEHPQRSGQTEVRTRSFGGSGWQKLLSIWYAVMMVTFDLGIHTMFIHCTLWKNTHGVSKEQPWNRC